MQIQEQKMLLNVRRTHQNLDLRLQASIIVQWGTEETQMLTRTKTRTSTSLKGSQVHIPIICHRNIALCLIYIGESEEFLK